MTFFKHWPSGNNHAGLQAPIAALLWQYTSASTAKYSKEMFTHRINERIVCSTSTMINFNAISSGQVSAEAYKAGWALIYWYKYVADYIKLNANEARSSEDRNGCRCTSMQGFSNISRSNVGYIEQASETNFATMNVSLKFYAVFWSFHYNENNLYRNHSLESAFEG
jgi:hypothetical protein